MSFSEYLISKISVKKCPRNVKTALGISCDGGVKEFLNNVKSMIHSRKNTAVKFAFKTLVKI